MKKIITVLLIGYSVFCAAGEDEAGTGNAFYHSCKTHSAACVSYISGINGAILWTMGYTGNATTVDQAYKNLGYCIPGGVTVEQQEEVFYKYLENHPENRQELIVPLAVKSWKQAWPCN